MDPEMKRRATRSEQRQYDDEKHPPRYCAHDDCTVEVGSGLYCEDHEWVRFEADLADDFIGGLR